MKETRKKLWAGLALCAMCVFSLPGRAWADDYLGSDWWLTVSTENVPWLNGSFTVAGHDRWGRSFTHKGNRLEIGRGATLGVFYVTGATRLTLSGLNFGGNFYPVPISDSTTPVLNGGNIEVATDGENHLMITIQNSPSLGQINTQIVFDGESKANVSNALATIITASLQNNGCSEIMTSYMVDGASYSVQPTSQTVNEPFNSKEIFGVMGGGTKNAPSVLIRLPQGAHSGYFQKDPSTDSGDDNVYLVLDQHVSSFTAEAWCYCAKVNADLSIDLPCVEAGGIFYDVRLEYTNPVDSSLQWRLEDFHSVADNGNCASVDETLRMDIPCVNVADGANYSAVLSRYSTSAPGYYWQYSSAIPDVCNQ